jgi:SAM-dependent methyltransferase
LIWRIDMDQQFELLLPPENLIQRVAGTSDPAWFVQSGRQSVKDIELALNSVGRTVAQYSRILDFGCGCGRIMLQWRDLIPMTAVTGVDIDADAVAWLRPHTPESTLRVINELPPMPFASASFDFVYCHSVFTHLDSLYQDRWLEELCRVCKPGAVLVVSFSGLTALHNLEEQWTNANADPAPLRRQLEDAGILFIADDGWKNGPFPDFYHSTFHTSAYVREHWGHYFKVLNHLPAGSLGFQDFIVMERTMCGDSAAALSERADKNSSIIPLPPEAFRALVGPKEDVFYDNPDGQLVFPEIPLPLYAAVFDFGCGCGRQARQLMQQSVRPEQYVGVDIHRGMVAWCQTHLAAIDPNFQFLHHNVYNPGLAPGNAHEWTAPFPVCSNAFTLVNAHSVFTHIYERQTEFYLREIERILTSSGVARTTWFFFDRRGYPWLEKWQHCLFVNAEDPTNAVIYDWQWFLDAVRSAGLVVSQTVLPAIPGHQWQVFLEKRREASVHNFPRADVAADWFCGAIPSGRAQLLNEVERLNAENRVSSAEVSALRNSWSWKLTRPFRKFADFLANW